MDSFELNKIIGAILGTLLFVMGVGFIAEAVYAPAPENGAGYALPEPTGNETAEAAPVEKKTPLPVLLASADPDSGAKIVKKCQACHNFEKGGANKTGPDLYGVVGRPIAAHEGFQYSDALKELAAKDTKWTYDEIYHFIESPRDYAPGTKMTFAGIDSEKDRADVLAYLQTLSDDPVPFPEPDASAAPADDANAAATSEGGAADQGAGDQAAADDSLPVLLANADADSGAKIIKKCKACHNFEKGGANKVGPDLYDVVGRPIAAHEGFNYSDALKELAAKDTKWTYDEIYHFIESPRDYAPGTKMTFAGIESKEDRADVLAYLQTLSDDPVPFPEPDASAAPADDADAAATSESGAADQGASDQAASAAADTNSAAADDSLPVLLANADADSGAKIIKKCKACHNFEKGGANKVGPDLYDVVGRPIAAHEGFNYSDALKELAAKDTKWTYDEIYHFIESPRDYAPGTKMTFAGIESKEDRADVLAYLQTLSDDPVPFPEPGAGAAATDGGASDQGAPAQN